MKFCPTCKTRYDEEILRFCTKDGTPLVEESEPNFTASPSSESEPDDLGEETIIRRKSPPPVLDSEPGRERHQPPRIVVPTNGETEPQSPPPQREAVRVATAATIRRHQSPRKSNTATVVFLTVLGTIAVLTGAAGIYWFLNNQNSNVNQDINYNANFNSIDINLNTNLNASNSLGNFDYNGNINANVNANLNVNANANANANLKTPTPTKTPTATPTPGTNLNANGAINTNANTPPTNASPTPPPRPSPNASPATSPPPTAPAVNRPVNAGLLNSRAVNLPKPAYPPLARQMRAEGQVAVQVTVDEAGNVTSARATSGNPMLRGAAEAAARQSKFNPVRVNNQPVPASGIVLYNFIN